MSDNNLLQPGTGAGAGETDTVTQPPAGGETTPPATEGETVAPPAGGVDVDAFINGGWKDCIPEDLRDRSEWNRVNNVQDVFKNYISAQQTISKSVRIPDATSTAEDITAFYAKLGKPASAAEYDFTYDKKEGAAFGKDAFDFSSFQEIADKANLTTDQYQKLATAYIDIQNDMVSTYQQGLADKAGAEMREAENALRKEWGKNYASNVNNISAKIGQMYPEDTLQKMEAAGLFRDSNFLKSQLALTKMMTGDTIFIEGRGVENVPQTIDDLRAKRDSLMNADYVKNKAQVNELNKQIVQLTMAQQGQMSRGLS